MAELRLSVGNKGCLPSASYVYTPRGAFPASEVYEGMKLLGGYVSGLRSFNDTIYRLIIDHQSFYANSEHPLWIRKVRPSSGFGQPNWLNVGEIYRHYITKLNPESRWMAFMHSPRQYPIQTISVGKSFAKLLGYLMSDGSFSEKQSVKFTNIRSQFLEEVAELSSEIGAELNFSIKAYQKGNGYDLLFTGKHGVHISPLKDKLRELGIINRQSFGMLQRLQIDELVEFVRGFFNGDGYLYLPARPALAFCLGLNQRHAHELQFMFWRLGINSYVYFDAPRNLNTKGSWELRIGESKSLLSLFNILDHTKYPEKFATAKSRIDKMSPQSNHFETNEGMWLPITRVERLGIERVYGWNTIPSHEIVCFNGLKTHNSGKSLLLTYFFNYAQQQAPECPKVVNMPIFFENIDDKKERNKMCDLLSRGWEVPYRHATLRRELMKWLAAKIILKDKRYAYLGMDEVAISEDMESRGSHSYSTAPKTHLIAVSRKANADMDVISQMMSMADKRIQWLGDVFFLALAHHIPDTFPPKVEYFEYKTFDKDLRIINSFDIDGEMARRWLYPRFDTADFPMSEEVLVRWVKFFDVSEKDRRDFQKDMLRLKEEWKDAQRNPGDVAERFAKKQDVTGEVIRDFKEDMGNRGL